MQNKGLIKTFAILFGLVSLYSISFSFSTASVEKKARQYAENKVTDPHNGRLLAKYERQYLDSVANDTNLYFNLFSYNQIKKKAVNLGLDLKGGINAILQVSVRDILIGLSQDSQNPIFRKALDAATKEQTNSNRPYLEIFFDEFDKLSDGKTLLSDPDIFGNRSLHERINNSVPEDKVKEEIRKEVDNSIATAYRVIRTRIDKFGVVQPKIQRIGTSGRIAIELPGARDIERIEKLLQSTAELQFWEAYSGQELSQFFAQANAVVAEMMKKENASEEETKDTINSDEPNLLDEPEEVQTEDNLFKYLKFYGGNSSIIGSAAVSDTATVNKFLNMPSVLAKLPASMRYVKFLWGAKPNKNTEEINLYAIKGNAKDKAPIQGDVIDDAVQDFQITGEPQVSMTMNSNGRSKWAKMTTENVGKFVAVVLDNYVYTAPVVNEPITGGRTAISGNFTLEEAKDLANVLKAGKLPAKAHIIQSEVVGASLGEESIHKSIISFALALLLVLLWMIFYYGTAGVFADFSLLVNILFIAGIMTAFGFVLTLPGIAGIILTMGMSVDANVIIYERIKEELNSGLGLKAAVNKGFSLKGALMAIIDANVTTLFTGIILYMFGTGPVKGFALTLIIGILTSLFTAIFVTRLQIDWWIEKGKALTFNTPITKNWFKNFDFNFLRQRKFAYILSGSIIVLGLISLFTNGLNYGVDFVGGRSYVVAFEQAPGPTEVARSLKKVFGDAPEVKTYGSQNRLKITTKYKIEEEGEQVDNEIKKVLFEGLKSFLPEGANLAGFTSGDQNQSYGIMHSIKVEPTIADDIKTAAGWAIFGSLLIVFLYILFRFKKWQFSFGAVAALFHDVMMVLAIFSITYKWMPFDMEVGQSFIAALLTVVGYSLNDTVVIFDRIREYTERHPSWKFFDVINKGLSSTLGRTINTSMTTFLVLVAIFLFGGDSIRGFMFALIIGVIVGTYSSLYVASPIMYDTLKDKESLMKNKKK